MYFLFLISNEKYALLLTCRNTISSKVSVAFAGHIYENNTEFISNFVSVLRLDAKSLSSHSVELLTVAVEEILKEICSFIFY